MLAGFIVASGGAGTGTHDFGFDFSYHLQNPFQELY